MIDIFAVYKLELLTHLYVTVHLLVFPRQGHIHVDQNMVNHHKKLKSYIYIAIFNVTNFLGAPMINTNDEIVGLAVMLPFAKCSPGILHF